ncbi:50S ribosomal protein L3 [Candidatus Gottesmanbacteria bacterium]|nr:50S ribosomal protein L3 [Candidatus Gottesmanbacteria bacterium]
MIIGKKLGQTRIFTEEGKQILVTRILLSSPADLAVGDKVKVRGTSKGKGFAGVVKRWHFAGGPRTRGQSDRERAPGSIGQTTTPGRVYKGKKMAGRMGGKRVTIKGLKIVEVKPEENLLVVKGLIPGPKRGKVLVSKI